MKTTTTYYVFFSRSVDETGVKCPKLKIGANDSQLSGQNRKTVENNCP